MKTDIHPYRHTLTHRSTHMSTPFPSDTRPSTLLNVRRNASLNPSKALEKVRTELTLESTTRPSAPRRTTPPARVKSVAPNPVLLTLHPQARLGLTTQKKKAGRKHQCQQVQQALLRRLELQDDLSGASGQEKRSASQLARCHAAWLLYLLDQDPAHGCLVRRSPDAPLELQVDYSRVINRVRYGGKDIPLLLIDLRRPAVLSSDLARRLREMDIQGWRQDVQGLLPDAEIDAIVQRIEHTQQQLRQGNGFSVLGPDDVGWAKAELPWLSDRPISTFDIRPEKQRACPPTSLPVMPPDSSADTPPAPMEDVTNRLRQALGSTDFPWPEHWSDEQRQLVRRTERDFRSHTGQQTPNDQSPGGTTDDLPARAEHVILWAARLKRLLDKLVTAWADLAMSPDGSGSPNPLQHAAADTVQETRKTLEELVVRVQHWADALGATAQKWPVVLDTVSSADLTALACTQGLEAAWLVEGLLAGWNVTDLLIAHRAGLSTDSLWATQAWIDQHPSAPHAARPDIARRLERAAQIGVASSGPLPLSTELPQAPIHCSMFSKVAWTLAELPDHTELQTLADASEALLRRPTDESTREQGSGCDAGLSTAAQQLGRLGQALQARLAKIRPDQPQLMADTRAVLAQVDESIQQLKKVQTLLADPVWQRPGYPKPGTLILSEWMTLAAQPELTPAMAAAGLLAGWSAEDIAEAHRLGCPAWTVSLANQTSRATDMPALEVAQRIRMAECHE